MNIWTHFHGSYLSSVTMKRHKNCWRAISSWTPRWVEQLSVSTRWQHLWRCDVNFPVWTPLRNTHTVCAESNNKQSAENNKEVSVMTSARERTKKNEHAEVMEDEDEQWLLWWWIWRFSLFKSNNQPICISFEMKVIVGALAFAKRFYPFIFTHSAARCNAFDLFLVANCNLSRNQPDYYFSLPLTIPHISMVHFINSTISVEIKATWRYEHVFLGCECKSCWASITKRLHCFAWMSMFSIPSTAR